MGTSGEAERARDGGEPMTALETAVVHGLRLPVDERTRTAFHEAGHFVVAHVLRCRALQIRAIAIIESTRHMGRLEADCHGIYGIDDAHSVCAVLLAGFYAESRFAGTPMIEAAATDLAQAEELIRDLVPPDDWYALAQACTFRASRTLEVHWAAVDQLARELLIRRRVEAPQAGEIVDRLAPKPPPLPATWPPPGVGAAQPPRAGLRMRARSTRPGHLAVAG